MRYFVETYHEKIREWIPISGSFAGKNEAVATMDELFFSLMKERRSFRVIEYRQEVVAERLIKPSHR